MTDTLGPDREPTIHDKLRDLRMRLGLTEHGMAELMYTSQQTYHNWETGQTRLRKSSEEKINAFIASADNQLAELAQLGVGVDHMVPLNIAAALLGVPHELLFHGYRDNLFQADDLGILGIWVDNADLDKILTAVTR
jgi:transcriptional regulator with XRE-family HTH domain